MFDRFTDAAKLAMAQARLEALRLHCEIIDVGHLLLGVVRRPSVEVTELLAAVGVAPAALLATVEPIVKPGRAPDLSSSQLPFTAAALRVLERMMQVGGELGHSSLGPGHLLVALAAPARCPIAAAMAKAGAAFEPLAQAFAARPADAYANSAAESTDRRASEYSEAQVIRSLTEMAQALDSFTGAAVEAQKFDAAAVLRELLQRVLLAIRQLRH